MIKDLLVKLAGLIVALSIAFGAGFYTKSRFDKADQVEAKTEVIHEAAQSVVDSGKKSVAIDAKVAKSNSKIQAIESVVVEHVKEVEKENEKKCEAAVLRLDVGTVGMLNAARTDDLGSPSISDEEGRAPSVIGFPEIVADELTITKLYKELAIRHDALVDAVQEQLEKQAK